MQILIVSPNIIPSVILCGLKQCEFLHAQGRLDYIYKPANKVALSDLVDSDAVLMIRGDYPTDEFIVNICKRLCIPVIYVLDDDLLNVPNNMASSMRWSTKTTKERIRRIINKTDFFVSPSVKLIHKYGTKKNSFRITEPSICILEAKPSNEDGRIHIGFAGSLDRGADVDGILSEALEAVQSKYGNRIVIEMFGAVPKIAKEKHIKCYPYIDSYEKYQEKMRELNWDIGLAPMPDTDFHSCKHYNKLVEYAGFGIAGIYSNVEPYQSTIVMEDNCDGGVENGVTGVLCDNSKDSWIESLSELIDNEKMRSSIQNNCLEKARTSFSLEKSANLFFGYLTTCLKGFYEDKQKEKVSIIWYGICHKKSIILDFAEKVFAHIETLRVKEFS